MPIGNLGDKVSANDINKVRDKRNPREFEQGYEPDDPLANYGFDDLSDDFGASGDNAAVPGIGTGGGQAFGQQAQAFGQQAAPQTDIFGQPIQQLGQQAGPFGQQGINLGGPQAPPAPPKKDVFDHAMEGTGEALKSAGGLMLEMSKSLRTKNADDIGYLSRNIIITGVIMVGASIVVGILASIASIEFLSFSGMATQLIASGAFVGGAGLVGLGVAAIAILQADGDSDTGVEELANISDIDQEDIRTDYEDNIGDVLDSLFEDDCDADSMFGFEDEAEEEDTSPILDISSANLEDTVDYSSVVDGIAENTYISREVLFNTFKNFFPLNTPAFAVVKELDESSTEFETIETICLKALANVSKGGIEDLETSLSSVKESFFSYEIRMLRVKGLNRTDDIANEIVAYFRDSSDDVSVAATVDIEGDYYKIVVTKGITAVVTFGDIFKMPDYCNYFLNPKVYLPFVAGINEFGKVITADAKMFDTMLIAGKPRSGKSWYVLSILLSLMLFNSPELVQFVLVDPKESNLFNTVSLMPHVCGLHNDKNILDVLRDIINGEGARRKKLLAANRCDDIWALWAKGVKLPVLYIVIDEVMTLKANLGDSFKEFSSLMMVIMSQLPSQGIRMIVVPHRSQGVIDKTNRTLVGFAAAVRLEPETVKETLDIKKWDRTLVNQGDLALRMQGEGKEMFVRGAALTPSDAENSELILNAAKAFYKMGVDVPDMTSIGCAYNRDEKAIRAELADAGERVQYDANNILKDLD